MNSTKVEVRMGKAQPCSYGLAGVDLLDARICMFCVPVLSFVIELGTITRKDGTGFSALLSPMECYYSLDIWRSIQGGSPNGSLNRTGSEGRVGGADFVSVGCAKPHAPILHRIWGENSNPPGTLGRVATADGSRGFQP